MKMGCLSVSAAARGGGAAAFILARSAGCRAFVALRLPAVAFSAPVVAAFFTAAGSIVAVAAGEGLFSVIAAEGAAFAILPGAFFPGAAPLGEARTGSARGASFVLPVAGREAVLACGAAQFGIVQHHDESLGLAVEAGGGPAFAERTGGKVGGIGDEREAEFGAGVACAARVVRHDEGVGNDAGRYLAAALRAAGALGILGELFGFLLIQLLEKEEG